MKINASAKGDEPVTKGFLRETLDERLSQVEKIFEVKIEKSEKRTDEKARQYRDEILIRLDDISGQLEQMREDNSFRDYDLKTVKKTSEKHEKRLQKLEKTKN